ncbi:hypothetical protein [Xenophilus azovorans]|uniref:hypothetical protein n=1 Tax=Xenophilus azovorans TaxID=151755 RepID=UPI000571E890|nr:hypothetical protein [Xenophilus azovorans]
MGIDLQARPYQPAASIIDFGAGPWAPIERSGRSARTLARIQAGGKRFGERFLAPYYGSRQG